MFAVIETATNKVVHLLGEKPVVTDDGMTSPIKALDVKPETHEVVEAGAPPFTFIPGLVTLTDGEWAIVDEYAHGKAIEPSRDQIDAERDRRTAQTFQFGGKFFQLDERSISRITAMGADARFATAAGAEEGDYFWADPTTPFSFIATDNSVMPMDAQTMTAFANAAKLWVSRHTFAGLVVKSMDPRPADYATNEAYWPS